MRKTTLIIALLASSAAHGQMFKCTDPATGRVTFSQTQCSASAETVDVGARQTPPAQSFDINSYAADKGYTAEFSGNALGQMNQAVAYIGIAKNLGRDCDWAIDVSKEYGKCMDFLAYVRNGGPYALALDKIISLMETNPELASGSTGATLRSGRYDAEQVEKYKAKAIASANMR